MQVEFRIAGALLVFLEVVGALSPRAHGYLPLAGSHIAQIAVVFGLAFVVYEFRSVFE